MNSNSPGAHLLRSGLGSVGVQIGSRALMLVTAVVLARTLGPGGYGVYAYAFALLTVLSIPAEAGNPQLITREVAGAHARDDPSLLRGILRGSQRFVMTTSTLVALAGILVIHVLDSALDDEQGATLLCMMLLLPLVAVIKSAAGAMRGLGQVVQGEALAMVIRPLVMVVLVGSAFYLYPPLRAPRYAMMAQIASAFIVLVIFASIMRSMVSATTPASASKLNLLNWGKKALPFTFIGATVIINNQADIIMLGWFREAEEVGIYRVAMQGGVLVGFVLQAAGAVTGPQFSRFSARGEREPMADLLRRTSRLVLLATAPIALVLIIWGGDLAALIFGSEFFACRVALAILAVGYLLNAAFGPVGELLQMVGYERKTASVLAWTALLNIGLNSVLIPWLGMTGAALTTALSVALYHMILRWIVRYNLGF